MNIGVFFGSRSPEHDISIITGQLIIAGLKKAGYKVMPVYLTKDGRWCLDDKLGTIEFFRSPQKEYKLKRMKKFYLDTSQIEKLVFRSKGPFPLEIQINLAFPAFHGSYGEDGTIQGLFEIFNIPYVGCNHTSSAVAMDKVLTKLFYERHNIPTTKFVYFTKDEWENKEEEFKKKIKQLKLPLFVKPARLGSSIGIAKVKNEKDLLFAIEVALHYDDKVLVEESVENLIDLTCAVLGDQSSFKVSLIQESVFVSDFFSYEDKYLKAGGAQLGKSKQVIIPARLDAKKTKEISGLTAAIFKLFGLEGIVRIDFLYNRKTGRIYANEINTLPGTLYHHLWDKSGVSLTELLNELIRLAQNRHQKKKKLTFTFASEVLIAAGEGKLRFSKTHRNPEPVEGLKFRNNGSTSLS